MTRLERVSQVAQILAGAAVVASLLVVASQIRDNTKAVQRGNALSSLTLGHDWDAWLKDPQFAAVYDAGLRDYAGLSGPEKLQFERYVGQGLIHMGIRILQY